MSQEPTAAEWASISGRNFTDEDRIWLEAKFKHQETLPVADLDLLLEFGDSV